MHSAPAVSCPVGRSLFQAVAAGVVWLGGALACVLWWQQVQEPGVRQMLAAIAACGFGAAATRAWFAAPLGTLRWDGVGWSWQTRSGSDAGDLSVRFELQRQALLGFRLQSGRWLWLWVERGADHDQWRAFRRALRMRPGAAQQRESARLAA